MPCDEIFDARELSIVLRSFLERVQASPFLLIIDEITFVKDWNRVIKALADEGYFTRGICLLTGSDTLMLKEAAMGFPGRRGKASQVDFHLYPLSFYDYVTLVGSKKKPAMEKLANHFRQYLQCGGYLRAINDLATEGEVTTSTYLTYEQWIRGDFLKQGRKEEYLMSVLQALLTVGVSQVSYSKLAQKIGELGKDTLIDYCRMLERMDLLVTLRAYDQNKKQGFPRKDRKFHFADPFIYHTLCGWLKQEGYFYAAVPESTLVEAAVVSHCQRMGKVFYFKGQGEIDVIWLRDKIVQAIEVKWADQVRPSDLKMLSHFENALLLTKHTHAGTQNGIPTLPVYGFLYEMGES